MQDNLKLSYIHVLYIMIYDELFLSGSFSRIELFPAFQGVMIYYGLLGATTESEHFKSKIKYIFSRIKLDM